VSAVFLDTAPLIYLVEGSSLLRDAARRHVAEWIDAGCTLWSSVLTLTELLVPAKRSDDAAMAYQYKSVLRELLSGPLACIDEHQAEEAAALRARYGVATPDALQLAAALALGCDCFFTNDRALAKVKEIEIVLVDRH
jgi:predicted nucleic acid-binding protein